MAPATALSTEECSTAPEFAVEVISDYDSFLKIEGVWNRLVAESGADHPFLNHEWFRTWWQSFGNGKQLHILLVRSGAEVIAIAPLMLTHGRIYGLNVRRLESIHNDHSPRFDLIVALGSEERAYPAIWSYLLEHKTAWDVLEISHLEACSRTCGEFHRLATAEGLPTGTWRSEDSPYIDLTEGWDAYVKRLSSQLRRKVRQHLRQLGELGPVKLEVVSSGEKIAPALADGIRLEALDWKVQLGTAIRCGPELVQFYTDLAWAVAPAGMLRLIFLTAGGTRVAFAYALSYKKKLFVLKAGYDPAFAKYSPYNVLCYLVFQDACERGLTEYEFLGANENWKLRWTTTTKPHCWLYVFPDTVRARLLHWVKFRAIPTLRHHRAYRLFRDAALALVSSLITRPAAPLGGTVQKTEGNWD